MLNYSLSIYIADWVETGTIYMSRNGRSQTQKNDPTTLASLWEKTGKFYTQVWGLTVPNAAHCLESISILYSHTG